MQLPPRDKKITVAAVILLTLLTAGLAIILALPYRDLALAGWFFVTGGLLSNLFILKIPFFPYDRILSAVSDPEGLDWNREAGIRLDVGGIHDSCQVYYPNVVDLDGSSYRLYYRAGGNNAVIASAYSTDGLNWREEPGIRVGLGWGNGFARVEGCDVLPWGTSGWRMYFSAFDGDSWRIYRCQSADGLVWGSASVCVEANGDVSLPHAKAPKLVQVGTAWRMYYMRSSENRVEVYTSFSADGDHWQQGEVCSGIRCGGSVARNPTVCCLKDGNLRIYFSERPSQDSTAVGACVRSALSQDGIHWRREAGVRIGPGKGYDSHGIFSVDILATSEGLRMYYSGYWGQHWFAPLTLLQYRRNSINYTAEVA